MTHQKPKPAEGNGGLRQGSSQQTEPLPTYTTQLLCSSRRLAQAYRRAQFAGHSTNGVGRRLFGSAAAPGWCPMTRPEQVPTCSVSAARIMRDPGFAQGVADQRAGRSPRFEQDDWGYERGRLWAIIAPRSVPLKLNGRLNPAAVALFEKAGDFARAEFPDLTPNGFDKRDGEPIDVEHVATAMAFLELCEKTKRPNFDSYEIKHFIERWGRTVGRAPYVSNGAAIVGAHAAGFVIERYSRGSPNASIGIRKRDIVQLTRKLGWCWS
jgi:hypothetical protein